MRNLLLFIGMSFCISACATAGKINSVRLGMTKGEVIRAMGRPASISAQGQSEYLNYALAETSDQAFLGVAIPYYVRLIEGKVESYGRAGDFDSTKVQTVRIESEQTVKQDVTVKDSGDIYAELKKLKELKDAGIITEDEFQTQKKKFLDRH